MREEASHRCAEADARADEAVAEAKCAALDNALLALRQHYWLIPTIPCARSAEALGCYAATAEEYAVRCS